eukprot:SM000036S13276  [mRNA]  locus=s36:352871:357132:+ [translate_table: standard]
MPPRLPLAGVIAAPGCWTELGRSFRSAALGFLRGARRAATIASSQSIALPTGQNSLPSAAFAAPGSCEAEPKAGSRSSLRVHLPPRLRDVLVLCRHSRIAVAPMMDWTDVHYRQLARLISKQTWLYTEMVVDNTLTHIEEQKRLDKFLAFPAMQRPIVLQLGGSNPATLAKATKIADAYDYNEINLNCGCPSDKVAGKGCFGARLMLQPEVVAEAVSSIASSCRAPVTVKCRIGVDDHDSYEDLCQFVHTVSCQSPVHHFIIHARKAHLKGLSPAENRTIPPLKHEYVFALLRDFSHLKFSLNGGITSLQQASSLLLLIVAQTVLEKGVHGVMIGRAAYHSSFHVLGDADRAIYGVPNRASSRRQILEDYCAYADCALHTLGPNNPSLHTLIKPLLGLFHGERGARQWRRAVDSALRYAKTISELLKETLRVLPDDVLDAPPGIVLSESVPLEQAELPPPPTKVQARHLDWILQEDLSSRHSTIVA